MRPTISDSRIAAAALAATVALPWSTAAADDEQRWPLLSGDDGRWAGCIAPLEGAQVQPTRTPPPREGAEVNIHADNLHSDTASGIHSLRGSVRLQRADQQLGADALRYEQRESRVDARGDLRYQETGLLLGADQGYLLLDRDQGAVDGARYLIPETLTQGEARRMELEDANVTVGHGTT